MRRRMKARMKELAELSVQLHELTQGIVLNDQDFARFVGRALARGCARRAACSFHR